MKQTLKFSLLSGVILSSLITLSCRPKQVVTEIGFSCNRLANCYSSYGRELKDNSVMLQVRKAQAAREETQCTAAIQQFSAAVGKECPF